MASERPHHFQEQASSKDIMKLKYMLTSTVQANAAKCAIRASDDVHDPTDVIIAGTATTHLGRKVVVISQRADLMHSVSDGASDNDMSYVMQVENDTSIVSCLVHGDSAQHVHDGLPALTRVGSDFFWQYLRPSFVRWSVTLAAQRAADGDPFALVTYFESEAE
ncbi:MAG TPA: hypothetical protein VFN56_05080 [Candidatus Saccharimonadales bacterium]|nr:hypothetical protein [Candidatus Saccharimonadales bacterium]